MFGCQRLTVTAGGRTLVQELSVELPAGRAVAMLGCNGAGKTLTLHTLAGLRPAAAGQVLLDDRPLADWPRRDRARRLGLLPQVAEDPFPSTVLETALIGRHPHLGFWEWEGPADESVARDALAAVGLAGLELRSVETLSGGERRRLAVATLLAQSPGVMLLDEPTNHLDPHHQHEVLSLARRRTDAGATVILSLHDATLAARYADDALLLFGDGRWLFGTTESVLTAQQLTELYASPIEELRAGSRRVFVAA